MNVCQQKFMILKQIDSHAYYLNIINVYSVFSVHLFKSVLSNLFSSQLHTADMLLTILINKHEEWEVENILNEQTIDRDKDERSIKKYKIKWKEDFKTCWNHVNHFINITALDCYEKHITAHAQQADWHVKCQEH